MIAHHSPVTWAREGNTGTVYRPHPVLVAATLSLKCGTIKYNSVGTIQW